MRRSLVLLVVLLAPAPAAAQEIPRVHPLVPGGEHPPLPLHEPPPPAAAPAAPARSLPVPGTRRTRLPLERGVSDGRWLLAGGAARDAVLDRAAGSGARVVRLPVRWKVVVRARPADETDPADPRLWWRDVDAMVRATAARGLDPLLLVWGAPAWAEGPHRWTGAADGTWAPDPAAFGRFAVALARRFDGTFPDPLRPGYPLPRVRRFQAWNEPNLGRYLQPQWVARDGRWAAWSPTRYRALLNAFTRGVKLIQPDATVLTAGTAPAGDVDGAGRMAPVRFWRGVLCLAQPRCADPARFDVLAHHPLSVGDPDRGSSDPQGAAIADLGRLKRLLRLAQRAGRVVPAGGQRLAVTELNWDDPHPAADGARTAAYVARGLELLWRQGVDLVLWQFVRDPPASPTLHRHPGGLWRTDPAAPHDVARDRPKPAYRAWTTPFTAGAGGRVWALAPGPRVAVQARRRGTWVTLARLPVVAGAARGRVDARAGTVLRVVGALGASRASRVPATTTRSRPRAPR